MIAKDVRLTCRGGCLVVAAIAFALMFLAQSSRAATNMLFDTNGTTSGYGSGGTFSWGGNYWATTSGGTFATGAYHNDSTGSGYGFPEFHLPGTTTLTIGSGYTAHTVGMYMITSNRTLNIIGPGTLSVETGVQGFLLTGSSSSINVYAPIAGDGGIAQQLSGAISFYGANTFSGGFVTTGGQVTNFNNANSFGTGSIQFTGGTGSIQGIVKNGAAAVTITNDVAFADRSDISPTWLPNTGINLVSNGSIASPGTTWSGHWHLAPSGDASINTGSATSYNLISGQISGAGNLIINNSNPANAGVLIVSGNNDYTGTTRIMNGTLRLGAANTIASSTLVDLEGGTLDSGGFIHAMPNTPLDIFGANTTNTVANISTASGGEIGFAESTNAEFWGEFESGTLNVVGPLHTLRFGTDVNGLRADQLAMIEFNSDPSSLGSGFLTDDGYLVPEPTSMAVLLLGAPLLLKRRRRRAA